MRVWLLAFLSVTVSASADLVEQVVSHVQQGTSSGKAGTFSLADYTGGPSKDLPIGVFDSGIGGLTVLEAILGMDAFHNDTLRPGADGKPDFANESFIYLGDQANMPYGNYSAAGKVDFLRELILRDAIFLLGRRHQDTATGPVLRDKPPVKAIVIACNTATAFGLEDIRSALSQWHVPLLVVGVVEAGARGVAEDLPKEMSTSAVGVLATVGTCSSGAYPKSINRQSGQLGKSAPTVLQQGSVGLAGAIEGDPGFLSADGKPSSSYLGPKLSSAEGYDPAGLIPCPDGQYQLNSVLNYLRFDLRALLDSHRAMGTTVPVQRLVLGCTHFPLVRNEIQQVLGELRKDELYSGQIAPEVTLINPAELTAKELFRGLAQAQLRRTEPAAVCHRFYISVPNAAAPGCLLGEGGKLDRSYQYGREPGDPGREDTVVVQMKAGDLPSTSRMLLEKHLPKVWAALKP